MSIKPLDKPELEHYGALINEHGAEMDEQDIVMLYAFILLRSTARGLLDLDRHTQMSTLKGLAEKCPYAAMRGMQEAG